MKSISLFSLFLLATASAHAITQSQTAELANAIQSEASSNEASFLEMYSTYQARLQKFNLEMNSGSNEKAVLQNYLNYLHREIHNQTGGSGLIYDLISSFEKDAVELYQKGDFKGAQKAINSSFGRVANFF